MKIADNDLTESIKHSVSTALKEDVGDGDITAALIPSDQRDTAEIITREDCVLCGQAWFNEVFKQLDTHHNQPTQVKWFVEETSKVPTNTVLARLEGLTRTLLTGERTALNFLQTLSGTATQCRNYADRVVDSSVKLLDTRKTIPGLRLAQKYAVTCGGCYNHRLGLFDAYLIKENHILACGGIEQAIHQARKFNPSKPLEIEVETLQELQTAIIAKPDIIMLDNFSQKDLLEALKLRQSLDALSIKFEVSGNVSTETLAAIAHNGVDFISIGALTKHCQAVDLSMRLV